MCVTLKDISWNCHVTKSIQPRILNPNFSTILPNLQESQVPTVAPTPQRKKGDNVFHKRSILKSKRSSATTLHQARKHQERVSNTPRHKTLPEPQLTSDLNLTDNQGETIKPKWTKQTPATVALTAFLTTGDDRHSLTTGDKRHYHYCHLRFLHQY